MIGFISDKFSPIMEGLAALFQSYPLVATYYTTVARFVFVFLALFIVVRSVISLLKAKSPPEIWGYLSLPDGSIVPILHWENVIGREKSTDLHVDVMTVSRNHGTLVRNERGEWRYNDLGSKSGSMINGTPVTSSTPVKMGDTITVGGVDCVLLPPSLEEKQHNLNMRKKHTKPFSPWPSLVLLTIFQILTCIQFIAARGSELSFTVLIGFAFFTIIMWAYCIVMRKFGQNAFEMEAIAFFLCTINLSVVATTVQEAVIKQLVAIILGMIIFSILCWYLRDLSRTKNIRRILVIASAVLLLVTLVFGTEANGAKGWLVFAGFNMQPAELVKIAFIFVGAGTLDELYERKNLRLFMIFGIFCLGCLAVMNDFGTAAIFFVTFVIILFLRSGDFSRLIRVIGVCLAGAFLALRFVPHIASRFATWRHAWDSPDAGGYQQVRGMSAGASGGLFGLGAGEGWFHKVFAADKDLVFSLVSEEWGLIIALLCVLSLIALCFFAVRSISFGRSSFYTIMACSATSLIIFQTILNVLGSLDILPFTGVTLPFISNGGTSIMASWGLLAFLKAADTRQNASFAVRSLKDDADEAFRESDRHAKPVEDLQNTRQLEDSLEGRGGRNDEDYYGNDDYYDKESASSRRKNRRSGRRRLLK